VLCGEKLRLSSNDGDSGSKKCKRGYGGVWRSLRLTGVWSIESGGRFCVGAFGRNLASAAVKMSSLYKSRTFNVISKDNFVIICITGLKKLFYSRQL
jgi:hypothetical protein